MIRTVIADPIPEKTTPRLTGVIRDEAGAAIPAASLTTLTLTLYNLDAAQTIINARDAVSILNANGGTVDSSGNMAFPMTAADTALVDATQGEEAHVALIRWTYNAGAKAGLQEILHRVQNVAKVT